MTNCTITANTAYDFGGGAYCRHGNPTLTNCIFWADTPQELYVYSGTPVVTYCNVQGGTGEAWFAMGCIEGDPLFAFPNDLHLVAGSPCIDSGTNDPVGGLPVYDLDGNPRPVDGDGDNLAITDMGVYEFDPGAPPRISLAPAGFEICLPEGEENPEDQILSLRNGGGGVLNWEITGQPAWLTVSPSSGESSGEVDEVALTVYITQLPVGFYTAVLEVSDPQAINSPREVIVALRVGRVLDVPSEHPTIQAAIDAAENGDFVEIADGTYTGAGNKDLDFGGKAITVRSASGDPALCVIDCEGDGRGFRFRSGETPDSIVEGLTITNGYADTAGGGVHSLNSSPTITDCRIHGSSAGYGGGVYGLNSSLTLTNCTISGNSSASMGGGVYYIDSSPMLTNCTISENSSAYGGGLSFRDAVPTVLNCLVSGNSAGTGGGVFSYSGNGSHGSSPTLRNCTLVANAASVGTAIACDSSQHSWPSAVVMANCVLWNGAAQIWNNDGSTLTMTYCNVHGGWPGEGNIDADPLFSAGPGGCYYLSQTAAGSPFESPCVDAGSDTAANLGLDGLTTRRDEVTDVGVVDIGYHYPVTGEPYRPGDINCDGLVDIGDFELFSPAMTGPGPWPAGTVTGCLTAGDLDDDGDLDINDFAAFQLVFEPGTP